MKQLIILITTLCLIASCNPNRRIQITNASGGKTSITWKLRESDSLVRSAFYLYNSSTLKFDLGPNQPYNQLKMSFGIGSWPTDTLAMITSHVESLEIKSPRKTVMLKEKEVYDYLLARRKGIGKRKIVIRIEE